MEYKISTFGMQELRLEKHMESKGFFRNATGSSKVGEIRLVIEDYVYASFYNAWEFENLLTKNDKIYYVELGCVEGPKISIGDKMNNIPAAERIKFFYEALISNVNYNRLTIIYKGPNSGRNIELLFEIDGAKVQLDDIDIPVFYINSLESEE